MQSDLDSMQHVDALKESLSSEGVRSLLAEAPDEWDAWSGPDHTLGSVVLCSAAILAQVPALVTA